MPDSCTHIAGECPHHEALRISRHNAACQLVHAAIRKAAKGGGALHSAPDLVLVMADTGMQPKTTGDSIESLSPTPENTDLAQPPEPTTHHWLAPLPTTEEVRRRRHTDVSQDLRYNHLGLSAGAGDAECTAAPSRIQDWVLPHEETQMLYEVGHCTAPDLIYARGVPNTPSPDPTSFDRRQCTLILVEIGLCMDLNCDIKHAKKTEKYSPLIAALNKYWGRVEFVAFPIGHAGTTVTRTLDQLPAAFFAVRPSVERSRASRGISSPDTDHNAKAHDFTLFKSLMDSITDLAQSRLLGIIRNRERLVVALHRGNGSRAHPGPPPSHHPAAHHRGAASHTHKARTTRAPESTAIP
jgi:hypothetical protein